ncbi:terminase small subunit [Alteromonas phage vB_AcoS-R7M]|uniref:Terminase small subunit n=1 Tax=Alteromonas phage vB_AcoS-R7M TaxID=2729541 RepID=A0A6M3YP53_9CAUD|nr:terminase small subunit [Alteromonas phage vB_AcoS-R7M]QJI53338.1 terminase small subunit [Alteromonas phage vB_AcoS-R7M]
MGPNDIELIDSQLREETLTEDEMLLRELFVKEYLVDYNAYFAALRVGFHSSFAAEYAKKLMGEGFVRRLIAKQEREQASDDQQNLSKAQVEKYLFREANYYGPGASHGARVSALSKLANIYGMDKEPESTDDGLPKGGVMVVPMRVTADEWGKQASDSQGKLKASVKD